MYKSNRFHLNRRFGPKAEALASALLGLIVTLSDGGGVASLERLVDAAGMRHPCDLDLLLFFNRHPDALMTSEQLAMLVGYELSEVASSLDRLLERQLLVRSQNPTHFARLYRFKAHHGGEVRELLEVASTVQGRRQTRQILRQRPSPPDTPPPPSGGTRSAKQETEHA